MKKITIILIILIIFIGVSFLLIRLNKSISPILHNYALIEANKLATLVITQSVNDNLINNLNLNNLYIITKDNENIVSIDVDPIILNKFSLDVINSIQYNLKMIEKGKVEDLKIYNNLKINYSDDLLKKGIFYEIPVGVVFNNSLLANLGPKIPIKFSLISNVITDIKTNITNYGINNALLESKLNIKIQGKVILPITSKLVEIEYNMPIITKIIQGSIPNYFLNTIKK